MKLYETDKRCYDISDYKYYLNKKVGEAKHKEKANDDDKLAKVLLFNLEHYVRYNQERGLTLTLYVLDHYAKIEKDENDAFGRSIINLSDVPRKVRQNLYREFREYNEAIEMVVNADEETLAELIEQGLVEVEGVNEEEIEKEKDEVKEKQPKKTKKTLEIKSDKTEDRQDNKIYDEENGLE